MASKARDVADLGNSVGIDDNATSTAITIDASENVGVGVVPESWGSGWSALQVGGNGALFADKAAGSGKGLYVAQNTYHDGSVNKYTETDEASRYSQSGGVHKWESAPSGSANSTVTFSERMRVDASGNVFVGKTTTGADGLGFWTTPDGRSWNTINNGSNTLHVYNNNESAYKFYVGANGGISNYSANNSNLSDERTKKDIVPTASHWNKVKGLEIVNYKYKTQVDARDNIGVIAQQVEAVAPEFVDSAGFGDVPDDGIPLKSVYESSLLYAALKALQEAQTRIETLETTVGLMESQLTALEVTP